MVASGRETRRTEATCNHDHRTLNARGRRLFHCGLAHASRLTPTKVPAQGPDPTSEVDSVASSVDLNAPVFPAFRPLRERRRVDAGILCWTDTWAGRITLLDILIRGSTTSGPGV